MLEERRVKRTNLTKAAIRHQLASSMRRAKIRSLVLADELGLVVTSVGDQDRAEVMAAISPRVAENRLRWRGKVRTLQGEFSVSVATVAMDSCVFFLCATGGVGFSVEKELACSRQGIRRILALN